MHRRGCIACDAVSCLSISMLDWTERPESIIFRSRMTHGLVRGSILLILGELLFIPRRLLDIMLIFRQALLSEHNLEDLRRVLLISGTMFGLAPTPLL